MRPAMTELRKNILEIVENSETPLMAKTIHEQLEQKPDLSTIYRALEYFEQNKRLIRISFFDKIYYYFSCRKPHNHFLICQYCHGIESFDYCTARSMEPVIENRYGFSISGHRLHFVGLCRHCIPEKEKE
jgi:Fur family ferric uptake transcriptional regulator